jgi:anti-sigma factor RsiW
MNDHGGPMEEHELHARIDGRLSRERATAIDRRLAADPEARRRWTRYAEQRQALRTGFAAAAEEPVPDRLDLGRILAARRRRQWRSTGRIAAGLALLALGGIAGWTAQTVGVPFAPPAWDTAAVRAIASDAVAAHRTFAVETRHPVEVDAAHRAQLVEWLSRRLGRQLVVPDLDSAGFRLIGGRLLPAGSGPAAQLMYENKEGVRLSCYYLAARAGETDLRYREDDGIGVQYWVDDGFGYAVAAKTGRSVLERVSRLVYEQTEDDAGKAKPALPGHGPS